MKKIFFGLAVLFSLGSCESIGFDDPSTLTNAEAIEKIKSLDIDLIITDIMMPFASGTEILSTIQTLGKNIPVIVLSSMGQEEVVIEAFDMGASDFMIKPFSPNELLLRIKKLANKQA